MNLSIIIVNFNTFKITAQCLKSIDKFPPGDSFEVIVVDNASSDGSIKKFKELSFKHFKLKLLLNTKNLGFAKANNVGIKESKGKYIMLLNSDTVVINNLFDELIDAANSLPKAGIVVPRLLNVDRSIQPSVFKFPTIWRAAKQYWFKISKELDKFVPESRVPIRVEIAVAAAMLLTPKALKKVGLLNEKYFMYFEDFDYCRSVSEAGLSTYYIPSSTIVHLHGGSSTKSVNEYIVNSSKVYFGMSYYFYTFILWSGQKLSKVFAYLK